MAEAAPPKTASEHNNMVSSDQKAPALQESWTALFAFTTSKHLPVLSGALFGAIVAALTLPVFAIVYGFIFREYTDYGAGKIDSATLVDRITKNCIILCAVVTVNWSSNSVYYAFGLSFGELQARSARNRIFDALMKKDMTWYDTRDTGIAAFLPVVQMNIRDLQLSVSAPLGESVQCMVQGLAALGVAFYFSWKLTFVIICTVPLVYIAQAFISARVSTRILEQAEKLQQALKYITNAIQNIEMVKCFNGECHELQSFTTIATQAASLYRRVANLRSMQIGIMQLFTVSIFCQGFWYGSHLVETGDRNPGDVITTFWAALMGIQGITGFLPQLIVLQKGKIAGSRLRVLMKELSTRDKNEARECKIKPDKCAGDIEFRNVSFSYPTRPNEVAIRDVTLFFPAGDLTFVIGKSGSGKSTLGQLLVQFYQPSSGTICLDSVSLANIDVKWLRENVTLVEQHSVLFNNTMHENIALGRPGTTLSLHDVHAAVKFAMLESTVRDLPDGLDTHLGMKGSALSGGQKQRLALARARIRDTPILVLDESTSALDYLTRARVLEAIREWRRGKTTIVITHDITQIQPRDFVYFFANAQVVQEGYRKELEDEAGPFQAFLASHERGLLEDGDDEDAADLGDKADEILSFYNEPWCPRTSVQRPISRILSAWGKQGGSMKGEKDGSKRNSRAGYHDSFTGYDNSVQAMHNGLVAGLYKTPLTIITPSQGDLHPSNYRTAPENRASQRYSFLEVPMFQEFGPRPMSRFSSRPVSYVAQTTSQVFIPSNRYEDMPQPEASAESKGASHAKAPAQLWNKLRRQSEPGSSSSLPITEILKSVWPSLDWHSRLVLLAAVLATVVHSAATPVFAWVFAQLLSTFYNPGDQTQRARAYALSIIAVAITDGLAVYCLFFLSDYVAQSWTLALKSEAMKRILLQPRDFFEHEENSVSRLAETLDHFAEEARNLPGRFAGIFLVVLLMAVFSIVWSLVICWRVALVALATGPILYVITKSYNMISGRWERLSNDADDEVGQVLHETFVNIRTVRCLLLENHFRSLFKGKTTAAIRVGFKRALYCGAGYGLSFAGVLFVAILLFWYGALLVSKDMYTVTAIVETFLILMLSINHIAHMSSYITQVNMARDAGSRLLRLARLPRMSHELRGTMQIHTAGDISFTNVSFAYPSRPYSKVLNGISFRIPHGSCTAIVGSSGSGKSTLATLLMKLYLSETDIQTLVKSAQPSSLTISGHDIATLHTLTLRSRIAIVSQTPVLFPTTIAANIAYGLSPSSPLSTLDSVKRAAAAAGVAEFIESLPQGYQTLVGDGGTGLSGGQAQRIAIARALVRESDILILDEATSALDMASMAVVRDTVRELVWGDGASSERGSDPAPSVLWAGGLAVDKDIESGCDIGEAHLGDKTRSKMPRKKMTVVIITHAKEMMAIAEHVVMLEKGSVVEEGSYRELKRKKGGAFQRLIQGEMQ